MKGVLERLPNTNTVTDICNSAKSARPVLTCFECNCVDIKDICQQCSVPYCHGCFEKLHSQGKAFRRHQLIPNRMKTYDVGEQPSHCSVHAGEELSYFCIDCKLQICVQCHFDEHSGHNISTTILEVSRLRFISDLIFIIQIKHQFFCKLQNRKSLPKLRSLTDTIQRMKETISSSEQVSFCIYLSLVVTHKRFKS